MKKILVLVLLFSLFASNPALAQDDDEVYSDPEAAEVNDGLTPSLRAAINLLKRAINFKKRNAIDKAIEHYVLAVTTDSGILKYDDGGILLDLIAKFRAKSETTQVSEAKYKDLEAKIKALEENVELLKKEKADIQSKLDKAESDWEEKEKEYQDQIKKLQADLKEAIHDKRRWRRKALERRSTI